MLAQHPSVVKERLLGDEHTSCEVHNDNVFSIYSRNYSAVYVFTKILYVCSVFIHGITLLSLFTEWLCYVYSWDYFAVYVFQRQDSKVPSAPQFLPSREKVYYEYYDSGNHWCKHCSCSFSSLEQLLQHNHTKTHLAVCQTSLTFHVSAYSSLHALYRLFYISLAVWHMYSIFISLKDSIEKFTSIDCI